LSWYRSFGLINLWQLFGLVASFGDFYLQKILSHCFLLLSLLRSRVWKKIAIRLAELSKIFSFEIFKLLLLFRLANNELQLPVFLWILGLLDLSGHEWPSGFSNIVFRLFARRHWSGFRSSSLVFKCFGFQTIAQKPGQIARICNWLSSIYCDLKSGLFSLAFRAQCYQHLRT
jgi:hypothetical protein